jgi:hypothetical protein
MPVLERLPEPALEPDTRPADDTRRRPRHSGFFPSVSQTNTTHNPKRSALDAKDARAV